MAKLTFLAYEGLRAVVGSEDPTQFFQRANLFKWSQMFYNLPLASAIWGIY